MTVGRRLPKWLYETLPYVYIAGGIATAGLLQNLIAMMSGMLLLSAGALILTMRHNYRAGDQQQDAVQVRESRERNGEQGAELLQIAWRPSFEVGHETIDRQHQRLVSLGNELITALMQRKPREDVELMLDVLVTEIGRHLKAEEEVAPGGATSLSPRLRQAHRRLLARASELLDLVREDQLRAADLVGFIAYDLITLHIVKGDLPVALEPRGRLPTAPGARVGKDPATTAR
jgi:hemerythrin-like metal-binding protein